MKNVLLCFILLLFNSSIGKAQKANNEKKNAVPAKYWNSNLSIAPYRLPPPPLGYKPEYIDLDNDGDPDIIKSITINDTPVMWIDDDDDMKHGDLDGDTDSDCLLIDRNKDGQYGALGDLIIDWVDTDNDNKPDMQAVMEYPKVQKEKVWPNGHYMWVLDTDKDNIFTYIDWNTFELKAWEHSGISNFFVDYSGQSMFMKVHAATDRMDNIKLNWENPFLFYDEDKDGLSEMAIRMVDSPNYYSKTGKSDGQETMGLTGKIDWVSIGLDMDNDNGPNNEFDFDLTLGFRGTGFGYMDQVHKFKNMRGLPEADKYFMDPRCRQVEELIYPAHNEALNLIFNKGKWDKVYFVYDEDDDCARWERVEFLDPLDPFKIGANKGGIDNNTQSDATGDRGEWDLNNSGKGKLYVSKFDGRLHLFGAEWGCWRIDQNSTYYQGWDRKWIGKEPKKFATVKYVDGNNNGFFDEILYDLDGDSIFESKVDLKALKIDDRCELVDISNFKYKDYFNLKNNLSNQLWANAQIAIKVAEKNGLNLTWYSKLFEAASVREKYHNGYWIQFYIYNDLVDLFLRKKDQQMVEKLTKAYFSTNWNILLK